VGVAVGNTLLRQAQPRPTPRAPRVTPVHRRRPPAIRERQPDALVVGMPFTPMATSQRTPVRAAALLHGSPGRPLRGCRCTGVDERD
jgi:RNase H-fold protein (predicted Holliday junction resolvase)